MFSNLNTVNKGIKLLIIVLVVLAFVIFVVFLFLKSDKQKQNIAPEKIIATESGAETESREECLARVKGLKLEELSADFFKKINSKDYYDYILPPGVLWSYYTSMLIMESYHCQLSEANDKDKYGIIYKQAKNYINDLMPGDKYYDIKLDYMNYLIDNSFYTDLIFADLDEACPDKLENACISNREINRSAFPADKNWCSQICEKLFLYDQNKGILNEEVVDFEDWQEDISLKSQYFWRVRVAYRFGGKESALKVCDNLPSSTRDKNFCLRAVSRDSIKEMGCNDVLDELKQILCAE